MPKLEEKQQVVKQLQDRIDKAGLIVFTDYRGLNVEEMTALRNQLRIPGVEYRVVKNTMMGFASEKLRLPGHRQSAGRP